AFAWTPFECIENRKRFPACLLFLVPRGFLHSRQLRFDAVPQTFVLFLCGITLGFILLPGRTTLLLKLGSCCRAAFAKLSLDLFRGCIPVALRGLQTFGECRADARLLTSTLVREPLQTAQQIQLVARRQLPGLRRLTTHSHAPPRRSTSSCARSHPAQV